MKELKIKKRKKKKEKKNNKKHMGQFRNKLIKCFQTLTLMILKSSSKYGFEIEWTDMGWRITKKISWLNIWLKQ